MLGVAVATYVQILLYMLGLPDKWSRFLGEAKMLIRTLGRMVCFERVCGFVQDISC